jgi:hypothetical protein
MPNEENWSPYPGEVVQWFDGQSSRRGLYIGPDPYGDGNYVKPLGEISGRGVKLVGAQLHPVPPPEYSVTIEGLTKEQVLYGAKHYACSLGWLGKVGKAFKEAAIYEGWEDELDINPPK